MSTAARGSARGVLRRVPATGVIALQLALAVLTVLAAWLTRWEVAVVGLALMQVVTVVGAVGPWGVPEPAPATVDLDIEELTDLEKRVDAMSSRLTASTERLRVEMLDAIADARGDREDRPRG